jgi:hypothetical protein
VDPEEYCHKQGSSALVGVVSIQGSVDAKAEAKEMHSGGVFDPPLITIVWSEETFGEMRANASQAIEETINARGLESESRYS